MKRKLLWSAATAVILAVLWVIIVPVTSEHDSSALYVAAHKTKQVGLAAKLYSADHQGRLPQSLDELAPDYLPDKDLLPGVILATPGAVLSDLSPDSVILFRAVTDKRRRDTSFVVIHPDISLEWKRP
jgi:hypothetical protein